MSRARREALVLADGGCHLKTFCVTSHRQQWFFFKACINVLRTTCKKVNDVHMGVFLVMVILRVSHAENLSCKFCLEIMVWVYCESVEWWFCGTRLVHWGQGSGKYLPTVVDFEAVSDPLLSYGLKWYSILQCRIIWFSLYFPLAWWDWHYTQGKPKVYSFWRWFSSARTHRPFIRSIG